MSRRPPAGSCSARRHEADLTHLDATGAANMVDVSEKDVTCRTAIAEGCVIMRPETLELIRQGDAKKGDVLGTARLAGIMASKRTHELIPLCHPLLLSKVKVDCADRRCPPGVRITAEVKVSGQTGVEMEALTAVSVACLTIYDMVKAADRGMRIEGIRLRMKERRPLRPLRGAMSLLPVEDALRRVLASVERPVDPDWPPPACAGRPSPRISSPCAINRPSRPPPWTATRRAAPISRTFRPPCG